MAKKSSKKIGGPFIASAVFCQSVSEDSDGVLSALRIVDEVRGIIPSNAPADFPSKEHPVEITLFALIMIRRGDAVAGKHNLKLVIESPKSETKDVFTEEIELPQPPNGAATVKARIVMKLQGQGLYWIDVILDKQRLSRMPLNIVLHREPNDGAKTT